VCLGALIPLVTPGGGYRYRVCTQRKTLLDTLFKAIARFLCQAAAVDRAHEMSGVGYALAFLLVSLTGTLMLSSILS
jgi:K+-transporting ATPase A subunit